MPKMKLLGQDFQKLEHEQDRQTDRHTDERDQFMHYYATFAGGNKIKHKNNKRTQAWETSKKAATIHLLYHCYNK